MYFLSMLPRRLVVGERLRGDSDHEVPDVARQLRLVDDAGALVGDLNREG